MITSLKIQNFKSFKEIDLKLGKLNFIIGSNASGKSNFMDALRFLQGIGYGFSFSEILDGKPKSAGSEVWEGIRGGSLYLAHDINKPIQINLIADVYSYPEKMLGQMKNLEYEIKFNILDLKLLDEYIKTDKYTYFKLIKKNNKLLLEYPFLIYPSDKMKLEVVSFNKKKSILGQNSLVKKNPTLTSLVISFLSSFLSNIQHVSPLPHELKDYSAGHNVTRMGEKGENFASLVKAIIEDSQKKEAYLSWLQHLRPEQINAVKILKGAVGESLFAIVEGGKTFPAPVLSDGTLRFAALAAAMFQPDMPAIMTIEEIESGIHPSRLRLLVELLRNRAEQTDTQFFITTHSPVLLSWLKEEEYQHTFYCKRDDATGESKLTPLSEMPHFADAVKTSSLGDLVSEGWMEANL